MYRYASKHYFLRIFRSIVALLRVEVGWREGSIYAFRESVNYRCKIPYNTKSVRVCKRFSSFFRCFAWKEAFVSTSD